MNSLSEAGSGGQDVGKVPAKAGAMPRYGRVIWILAGEASGDVIGARLMQALHARDPSLVFAGVGGGRMEALGLHSLFPMSDLAVMGLVEVLPRVRKLSQRLLEAVQDIELRKPDLVVTIDSPGFALRLLQKIERSGIKRVHYVAPQVWAWKENRVKEFPGLWDRLLCLLPFEPEWFAERGLEGRFVGHPVLQSGVRHGNAERFRKRHNIPADAPVLILMPGSRRSEAPRLLPIFRRMLDILRKDYPNISPVIPIAPVIAPTIRNMIRKWPIQPHIVTDIHDKHDAFAAAQAALTKSGTSTLELAMGGVPMAVTYRVNPVTATIARRLIKVPYVAMVNLLAGREVVPELLQENCTPQKLAAVVSRLLSDPVAVEKQRMAFDDVLHRLAPDNGTPSDAAAEEILDLLNEPVSRSPRKI
ncbi:lipid-A-disaccharide synthase [Gluconobacter morbifer]|uniref:Lipid-A-disaccharide synthase n=1 Tax=Gluconobacter morbifer G707 TaxID=1088869 RepID=G6XKS1_9PROT|nr:lipid-A-disaccharide synthase [Gluconobacter morbifer]EHH67634.1 lipid-A-disaccharide synthase [Gluconobacter morbifer G707]